MLMEGNPENFRALRSRGEFCRALQTNLSIQTSRWPRVGYQAISSSQSLFPRSSSLWRRPRHTDRQVPILEGTFGLGILRGQVGLSSSRSPASTRRTIIPRFASSRHSIHLPRTATSGATVGAARIPTHLYPATPAWSRPAIRCGSSLWSLHRRRRCRLSRACTLQCLTGLRRACT